MPTAEIPILHVAPNPIENDDVKLGILMCKAKDHSITFKADSFELQNLLSYPDPAPWPCAIWKADDGAAFVAFRSEEARGKILKVMEERHSQNLDMNFVRAFHAFQTIPKSTRPAKYCGISDGTLSSLNGDPKVLLIDPAQHYFPRLLAYQSFHILRVTGNWVIAVISTGGEVLDLAILECLTKSHAKAIHWLLRRQLPRILGAPSGLIQAIVYRLNGAGNYPYVVAQHEAVDPRHRIPLKTAMDRFRKRLQAR